MLTAFGLVKGMRLTAYDVLKADVEGGSGVFLDQVVVVDGNLVLFRGY